MSIFSGNTLRKWSSKLLARDAVFRGVQRALHSSLDARRAIDRNAERVFSVLDIPSRAEIERLQSDIDELDESLVDLQHRVCAIHAGLRRRADS